MVVSSFRSLSRIPAKLCRLRINVRPTIAYREYAITGNTTTDKYINSATGGKAEHWLTWYEHAVGLAEVRQAQGKVVEAEHDFITHQTKRREKQMALTDVQAKLRTLSAELGKVHRGEERYLMLLTQEHSVVREENRVREQTALLEEEERTRFAALSAAVRESHERERVRTERTKYWSLIGSVIGAAIGIIGTSINNYLRMRELRGLVTDSAEGGEETRGLVMQLSETMKSQHNQLQSFIADLKRYLGPAAGTAVTPVTSSVVGGSAGLSESAEVVESRTKELMQLIRNQDSTIKEEMQQIKQFLSKAKITDEEGNTVYIGPLMGNMLENTEKNLEYKMKINSLWTVTFIYGAFALTIPVLYNIFRGG